MNFESVAIFLGLVAASIPIARSMSSRAGEWVVLGVGVVLGLAAQPLVAHYRATHTPVEPRHRPVERLRDDYVSSDECRACHPAEYDSWKNSWHRTMTQVASPEAVFGDFSHAPLERDGQTYQLTRRGDRFFAHFRDPAQPEARWHEIVLTTGSHHMQTYWYARGEGKRVGFFPFSYLKQEARWVPGESTFLQPPDVKQEPGAGSWNDNCVHCHTTRGRPGMFDASSHAARTDAVEFGIACEACHGPGREHIEANRDPTRRYGGHLDPDGDETVVNAMRLTRERSAEVCGQCHGISESLAGDDSSSVTGYSYRAGEVLDETNRMVLRGGRKFPHPPSDESKAYHDTLFWSDGMVRVSGREMNGLLESPCFQHGEMTCLSCHQLHRKRTDERDFGTWADDQLARGMRGNEACLQCHENYRDRVAEHSNHPVASGGSECMNCHMPYTTWGLMKAIRQHTVDSPSVASSLETGRANACNACHVDQPLAWSAQWMNAWYAQPIPELDETERTTAASLMWLLRGDAGQRVLSAWYLGWPEAHEAAGKAWIPPHLAALLDDPYDVVRHAAGRSLMSLPGYEDLAYDYVGTAAHREERAREALSLYLARGRQPIERAKAERLLLYEDGSVDRVRQAGLERNRDDRPVSLAE